MQATNADVFKSAAELLIALHMKLLPALQVNKGIIWERFVVRCMAFVQTSLGSIRAGEADPTVERRIEVRCENVLVHILGETRQLFALMHQPHAVGCRCRLLWGFFNAFSTLLRTRDGSRKRTTLCLGPSHSRVFHGVGCVLDKVSSRFCRTQLF